MFTILGLHKFRTFLNLNSYFVCSNIDLQRTSKKMVFFESIVFSGSFDIDYPKLSYHNLDMSGYRSNTTLTSTLYLKMFSYVNESYILNILFSLFSMCSFHD